MEAIRKDRKLPNILVCGTPGTGKTTFVKEWMKRVEQSVEPRPAGKKRKRPLDNWKVLDMGKIIKDKELHDGWNEKLQSYLVDDDLVCDELEPLLTDDDGGYIIDWHVVDLFTRRTVDLVIVLRVETRTHFDRLKERTDYSQAKIEENIDAEIMQVVLDEARATFSQVRVVEMCNDSKLDLGENLDRLEKWVEAWKGGS